MDIRDPVGTNITNSKRNLLAMASNLVTSKRNLLAIASTSYLVFLPEITFPLLHVAAGQTLATELLSQRGTGKCSDGRAGQMGMGMETMAYD